MNEKTLAILLYISLGIHVNNLFDKVECTKEYIPPIINIICVVFWPFIFLILACKWLGGSYGNR